jgi:NhaP-type Na+/H+ and K+/H+ antiporter
VPQEWSSHPISDLIPDDGVLTMAVVRCGKATMPDKSTRLQTQDILHVSATAEGASILRQRLHENGNGKE